MDLSRTVLHPSHLPNQWIAFERSHNFRTWMAWRRILLFSRMGGGGYILQHSRNHFSTFLESWEQDTLKTVLREEFPRKR